MSAQVDALGRRTTYEHDLLGRRTGRVLPLGQPAGTSYHERFVHDPVTGFLLTRSPFAGGVATTTHQPEDNTDRVASIDWASHVGSPDVSFSYWPDGPRRQVEDPSGTAEYTYDGERGRLERVELDGGTTWIGYGHDADGIRQARAEAGVGTTTYLVDSSRPYAQVLEETSPSGELTRYIHGHRILAQHRPATSELRWFVHDHLGTIRALLDESGDVTDTFAYEAFGTRIEHEGTTECSVGFTGEQWDPATDLVYLRARWMAPERGTFGSADPIDGHESLPSSLHDYTYANNRPVEVIDPLGESGMEVLGGVTIATAVSGIMAKFGYSGTIKPGPPGSIRERLELHMSKKTTKDRPCSALLGPDRQYAGV